MVVARPARPMASEVRLGLPDAGVCVSGLARGTDTCGGRVMRRRPVASLAFSGREEAVVGCCDNYVRQWLCCQLLARGLDEPGTQ